MFAPRLDRVAAQTWPSRMLVGRCPPFRLRTCGWLPAKPPLRPPRRSVWHTSVRSIWRSCRRLLPRSAGAKSGARLVDLAPHGVLGRCPSWRMGSPPAAYSPSLWRLARGSLCCRARSDMEDGSLNPAARLLSSLLRYLAFVASCYAGASGGECMDSNPCLDSNFCCPVLDPGLSHATCGGRYRACWTLRTWSARGVVGDESLMARHGAAPWIAPSLLSVGHHPQPCSHL